MRTSYLARISPCTPQSYPQKLWNEAKLIEKSQGWRGLCMNIGCSGLFLIETYF
nr:hypothetical protein [uncultured Methylotenera sp.]